MKKVFNLSLFNRVFLSTITISALIIFALGAASYFKLEEIHLRGKEEALYKSVDGIRAIIDTNGVTSQVYATAEKDFSNEDIRTTLILKNGVVIYDSNAKPEDMLNHANRPEVKKALEGKVNFIRRFSDTTKESFLYIASPAGNFEDGTYEYCIRQAIPIENLHKKFKVFILEIVLFCLATILVAGILSLIVAKKISTPLKNLTKTAHSYEEGNFDAKITDSFIPEINKLSRSMQSMASELKVRINSLNKRNSELDEIFEQMTQIVFICNSEGRLLRLNQAGFKALEIKESPQKYRVYIREVIRNTSLIKAIEESFSHDEKITRQIEHNERNYILQSKVLPYDSPKRRVLCVLNDITHISVNENLRREFVSGVSHELKTPITAIQMAVETIQECSTREEADNFLDMINKETLRMNTLVDDMLLLSKIEYAESMQMKNFKSEKLKTLLEEAISYNEYIAHTKQIAVKLECPDSAEIKCDATLIKLAFSNLINNSIKYGNEASKVKIEVFVLKESIELTFRDASSGIQKEDLDRIFERFYRVNKGRSRNLGGTGLGLAIVKHIIKLHNATISVSSKVGQGSTFTIIFKK